MLQYFGGISKVHIRKGTLSSSNKHDPESELGIKIRQWVIYNKLEDFNSLLNYTDEDFKPDGGGNLS